MDIKQKIINGDKEGLNKLLDEALKKHTANDIIKNTLLPAFNEAINKYKNEKVLPFLLESAQAMKKALEHLNIRHYKAKVLVGTIEGDVHAIGTNTLKTILENLCYEIIDLGEQATVNDILQKAKQLKPNAIILSTLLEPTKKQIIDLVKELQKNRITIPLLLGGPAINNEFILELKNNYNGEIFYCKNIIEGIEIIEKLI